MPPLNARLNKIPIAQAALYDDLSVSFINTIPFFKSKDVLDRQSVLGAF